MTKPSVTIVSDSLPSKEHPIRGIFNSNIVDALRQTADISSCILWNERTIGWRKLHKHFLEDNQISEQGANMEVEATQFIGTQGRLMSRYFQSRLKQSLKKNEQLNRALSCSDNILVLGGLELISTITNVYPHVKNKIHWIQHVPQVRYELSQINLLNGIARVFVPSQFAACLYMASTNYLIPRPAVILNPVHPGFLSDPSQSREVNRSLVGVATNTPMKDLKLWVHITNRLLKEKVIQNATLITASFESGQSINEANLDVSRITILCNLKPQAIAEEYRKHSFFLSTSHVETFGLSILEASLNGCWPIVRYNGGIHEYLDQLSGHLLSDFTTNLESDLEDIQSYIDSKVRNQRPCELRDANKFSYLRYAERLTHLLTSSS